MNQSDTDIRKDEICEAIARLVDDPSVSNSEAVGIASRMADPAGHPGFVMDILLEFSVWSSGSPLMEGRLGLAKLALAAGGRHCGADSGMSFGSLLHVAAENSSAEALEWVAGLNPEAVGAGTPKFGSTPLHIVAQRPAEESVPALRILMSLGADPNARDSMGRTPVFHSSSLEFLLAIVGAGADPGTRDRFGMTPASLMLSPGCAAMFAAVCRMSGADAAAPMPFAMQGAHIMAHSDPAYALPLSWLIRNHGGRDPGGLVAEARILMDMGADPCAVGPNGRTPMEEAALLGLEAFLQGAVLESRTAGGSKTDAVHSSV